MSRNEQLKNETGNVFMLLIRKRAFNVPGTLVSQKCTCLEETVNLTPQLNKSLLKVVEENLVDAIRSR